MKKEKVNILLIERSDAEASKIKIFLTPLMSSYTSIIHFNSSDKARGYLDQESDNIDVILLDLMILDDINQLHVFKKVNASGNETPVIVFTSNAEHELAKKALANGAADNVVMEIFQEHPETLRDAILFSLSRNNIILEIKAQAEIDMDKASEEHKQIVHMLTGGYSLQENIEQEQV